MNDGGERNDWIRELTETSEQLGRLSEQLEAIQGGEFSGIIERIQFTQARLLAIRSWLEKRP